MTLGKTHVGFDGHCLLKMKFRSLELAHIVEGPTQVVMSEVRWSKSDLPEGQEDLRGLFPTTDLQYNEPRLFLASP